MGFVMLPSIAKPPESGAPSKRELRSRGSTRAIGLCVVGFTLDAVCAEDGALEEIHPTVSLPTITVEARFGAFDPAFETNSITVLDRDTLARFARRTPRIVTSSPIRRVGSLTEGRMLFISWMAAVLSMS
jgi:hypothetical protein